jgi:hypothetical protein
VKTSLLITLLLGGCAAGPPALDACLGAQQQRAALDAVEIGEPDDAEFRPIAEGATMQIVRGPQGGDMVALRIRALGAEVPSCLQQTTRVSQGGQQVTGTLATPLATYADAPGTRATRTTYVILSAPPRPGEPALISVECGGLSVMRTVRIE